MDIENLLAKSPNEDGEVISLSRHGSDAKAVAEQLWENYLPDSIKHSLTSTFGSTDLVKKYISFCAGTHDTGKASPAFFDVVPGFRTRMGALGFTTISFGSNDYRPRHELISYDSLRRFLVDVHGLRIRDAKRLAAPVLCHHGVSHDDSAIRQSTEIYLPIEDSQYKRIRMQLIESVQRECDLSQEDFQLLATAPLNQPAQAQVSGIVIMADWIASNEKHFPFRDKRSSQQRAEEALKELDFPENWCSNTTTYSPELFRERFNLPPKASPRPVQESAILAAEQCENPSMILIEAPTGEGKTEAAFAAAEILATKFGCGGLLVALPTCATTDALFGRALPFLQRSVGHGHHSAINLCHGRAAFNDSFTGLWKNSLSSQAPEIHDEDGSTCSNVTPHEWFFGRKQGLLANFVIGTIDQVLMASLKSKHLMLRHLGLAGKVVILDEIHASDEYMMVYLEITLNWLGAMRVPVIALSATLPPERKERLLTAYRKGRTIVNRIGSPKGRSNHIDTDIRTASEQTVYPLITCDDGTSVKTLDMKPSSRQQSTSFSFFSADVDELPEVGDSILQRTRDGGCVIAVMNTVKRAQELYDYLCASGAFLPDELTLLHSRFIATDRAKIEKSLLEKLGPPSAQHSRPHRYVVVATQIIEQSLDIDADLMYSDIAPVDLLIQRLGRLHRHNRPAKERPESLQNAQLIITGVTQNQGPLNSCFDTSFGAVPEFESGSEHIYAQWNLLRTYAVLKQHIQSSKRASIVSPHDVHHLVRAAASPELPSPKGWEDTWMKARTQYEKNIAEIRKKAEAFRIDPPHPKNALIGWNSKNEYKESDGARAIAAVRDIDSGIDVIVIQRQQDEICSLPGTIAEDAISLATSTPLNEELAKQVARCTVSLPSWTTRGKLGDALIANLEADGIPSWQSSRWLKGELALILDEDMKAQKGDLEFIYDRKKGLSVTQLIDSNQKGGNIDAFLGT